MTENPEIKSQLCKFLGLNKFSFEFYGTGDITFENLQSYTCNFGVIQLSNGDTYFAIDSLGPGEHSLRDIDSKFSFKGVIESGSIIIVKNEDVQFFNHGTFFPFVQIYLIRRFFVETANKNTIKRINFGLTNFLFTGENSSRDTLSLNLRDLPSISIRRLPDYDAINDRLKNKISIEVTSELAISFNSQKVEEIMDISYEICGLLSICRGSKIFWVYYCCYDEYGGLVRQTYCDMVTRPLSKMPELIDSDLWGVESTKAFLDAAHSTVSQNSLLMKYLSRFSNVFVEARDGKGFIESRGVRIVVVMEMLAKYVLENPYFEIKATILDPSTHKSTKKEIIEICKSAINTKIGDLDGIRFSSRWNLPTVDQINAQIRVFENREDLSKNLSSINHTPFRRIIVRLCEKIHLEVSETEIKRFVDSRNALIHTGKYYSDPLDDRAVFEEYSFLVNFLDRVFLKLFNYSGEYNNFQKWGNSLRDTI